MFAIVRAEVGLPPSGSTAAARTFTMPWTRSTVLPDHAGSRLFKFKCNVFMSNLKKKKFVVLKKKIMELGENHSAQIPTEKQLNL